MTTKITLNDLDQDLKDKLEATGSEIVSPGNVAKFGDTTGIATLTVPDETQQRLLLRKEVTNPSDFATMQLLRQVDHGGGVAGYVGFGLNAKTEVRGSSLQSEWTGFFGIDNYSTASGTWPQHVAVYGQANKRSPTSTWAGCLEINDEYGSGAAVGLEITARCNGVDHPSTPQRNGSHISIMRGSSNTQDGEWGRGYWVTTGARSQFRYGFAADGSCSDAVFKASVSAVASNTSLIRDTSTIPLGIDLSAASYSSNIALALKAGHAVSWEATQQVKSNYDQSTSRWQILKGATPVFWVDVNTGQTSITTGAVAKYISAGLSASTSISTGSNIISFGSVKRDTSGGLLSIAGNSIVISPNVAEFEVVSSVQAVGSGEIKLQCNLVSMVSGVIHPNPRQMASGTNPTCGVSTGVIFNPNTAGTSTISVTVESSASMTLENSGATGVCVRVISTR